MMWGQRFDDWYFRLENRNLAEMNYWIYRDDFSMVVSSFDLLLCFCCFTWAADPQFDSFFFLKWVGGKPLAPSEWMTSNRRDLADFEENSSSMSHQPSTFWSTSLTKGAPMPNKALIRLLTMDHKCSLNKALQGFICHGGYLTWW